MDPAESAGLVTILLSLEKLHSCTVLTVTVYFLCQIKKYIVSSFFFQFTDLCTYWTCDPISGMQWTNLKIYGFDKHTLFSLWGFPTISVKKLRFVKCTGLSLLSDHKFQSFQASEKVQL